MTISKIHTFLQENLARVETCITTSLHSDIGLLESVNRGLREHPGKMLRPMLALLVAGAAGKVNDDSIRFAAAAELLHNATLLHDDVVDGATERRGVPTAAKLLGGSAAVLVGDYWLVNCMQTVLDADHEPERVLRIFSRTLHHLAEGELLQMEKASLGNTTQEDYLRIVYGKTASLFEASATAAAVSVQADEDVVKAAGRFGRLLGIAFQIKDDIFDYNDADRELGKPVGIDLLEQKITQPLLCALEGVSPQEAAAVREKVSRISDQPALAEEVRKFVIAHDGVAKADAIMNDYIDQALSCLDVFRETPEKQYLTAIAHYIGNRNY